MSRREVRETAMQILFQVDVGKIDREFAFATSAERVGITEEQDDYTFLKELVFGVWENQDQIDKIIGETSVGWELSRIANVDRNILRIAIFEMRFLDNIPERVSINEAIEMGKAFGTEESGKFINGILGNIVTENNSAV